MVWRPLTGMALLLTLAWLGLGALAESVIGYGDWRQDAPGVRHRIDPAQLPPPYATEGAGNGPSVVKRPAQGEPRVPPGFAAELWASGLDQPRAIRVAPNGDVFLAESGAGRIRVFSAARPGQGSVFASGLSRPFGIAFWPPTGPRFVYVAETGRVVRFGYAPGELAARGGPDVIIARLPQGNHWTRDLAVAPDGSRLFVSVGSGSNIAAGMAERPPEPLAQWEAAHGRGAAWGDETERADVLQFTPDGRTVRPYATGLRNCSGLAIQPATGDVWCATNERDMLGDDLPPDYVTHVTEGGFYGWPWFYIGAHEDPRLKGRRPDLAKEVIVPDVLVQPHSAPLGMVFYPAISVAGAFPVAYRGDAFVALHGSWNRSRRVGYKVIRVLMRDGRPTGEYEDFLTGFVVSDSAVWARPVDVAVAADGALLVTEDGNGTIWRVRYGR